MPPRREGPASDCIALHVADAVLGFALGAGAVGRAGPRPEAPVLGECLELVVEYDGARCRIVLDHQRA
jgi:hypothetical protein